MPYHVLPRLSYIVPFCFNQGSVQPLYDLLSRYNDSPATIKQYIQFILVDDCSVETVILPPHLNLNIKLLRITDDIQWNQPGAKNLGITMSPTSKILSTDIDHYIPTELLGLLLESPEPYQQIFLFDREKESGEKIREHLNTFFTSKSVFFKSLGYDEQFCGNYGLEDGMFILLQECLGTQILHFNCPYPIKYLEYGGKHHSYVRDMTNNIKLFANHKKCLLSKKDPFLCHSRLFLNFQWEIVEERYYHP